MARVGQWDGGAEEPLAAAHAVFHGRQVVVHLGLEDVAGPGASNACSQALEGVEGAVLGVQEGLELVGGEDILEMGLKVAPFAQVALEAVHERDGPALHE